ncbi:hypothetical protein MKK67_11450 [Methylobacterium sp. J-072]|uniref:hypothetical protein n=1 Tax=Methylobacterium sp. J-072 TaxID=2836651 RepID=UPI001FBA60CC|nr:hypothetical protein [Methylobacterium sp. J-072]MCJ2093108.1 hypothetical protein [Methylobacterium sp. J-072]
MSHAFATARPTPSLRISLAERTAALSAALTRVRRTPVAPQSDTRAALLVAYVEAQDVRPIFEQEDDHSTLRYRAALKVEIRLRRLVSSVVEAPTPITRDGLATLALAMAIDAEGRMQFRGDSDREYARAARALVLLTGTTLPAGFLGFGDEPGFEGRETALLARPSRLPEWAQVEASAAA